MYYSMASNDQKVSFLQNWSIMMNVLHFSLGNQDDFRNWNSLSENIILLYHTIFKCHISEKVLQRTEYITCLLFLSYRRLLLPPSIRSWCYGVMHWGIVVVTGMLPWLQEEACSENTWPQQTLLTCGSSVKGMQKEQAIKSWRFEFQIFCFLFFSYWNCSCEISSFFFEIQITHQWMIELCNNFLFCNRD